MKSPEETKKVLNDPIPVHFHIGDPEPRLTPLTLRDLEVLHTNALALIQQLQDDNAEKDKSMQQLERSLSFARDLADGLKAATVKQEQELYVSEERNRQLETQNAELSGKTGRLEAERDAALENIRGDCVYCLHLCEDMVAPSCFDCANKGYYRWEWRGVQKEG